MDMYTAGLVRHISRLDRPYAPYRTDEDAYYDANAGFELPNVFAGILHALHALRRVTRPPAPGRRAQTA